MGHEIHITLRFNLATGKAGLNEILYEIEEFEDPLMLKVSIDQMIRMLFKGLGRWPNRRSMGASEEHPAAKKFRPHAHPATRCRAFGGSQGKAVNCKYKKEIVVKR
jgi:hypothetical protein